MNHPIHCKDFKVGDVITAYHKGLHVITNVGEFRVGCSTYLITYKALTDSKFKPVRSAVTRTCDSFYCQKVGRSYMDKFIRSHETQLAALRKVFDDHGL